MRITKIVLVPIETRIKIKQMADGTKQYVPQRKHGFWWMNMSGHGCDRVHVTHDGALAALKQYVDYKQALKHVEKAEIFGGPEGCRTKIVRYTRNDGSLCFIPYRRWRFGWKQCIGPRIVNGHPRTNETWFQYQQEAQAVLDYYLSHLVVDVAYT